MKDKELKILRMRKNKQTKWYSSFFEYRGVIYYADLTYCWDVRANEMMVFLCNEKREVVNRSELYVRNFPEVSKENLKEWIISAVRYVERLYGWGQTIYDVRDVEQK